MTPTMLYARYEALMREEWSKATYSGQNERALARLVEEAVKVERGAIVDRVTLLAAVANDGTPTDRALRRELLDLAEEIRQRSATPKESP